MRPAWTKQPAHLHGELVDIREVIEADASSLFELLSDPAVAALMTPPPPSLDAFRGFIAWAQREREAGRSVCFGILPVGLQEAVGIIQLRAQEPSWFTAEWGFAIGAAFWGTGAFLDAAQLAARFAFEEIGVQRLEARAMVANGRGNGVLQKLGARTEGALASAFARDGKHHPQFLWGLHIDDWRQKPLAHDRFQVTEALASIAAAKKEISERLRALGQKKDKNGPPPLYPFFAGGN